MSSSSTTKAPCATCGNKGVGIFKCEGCAQVFCRKHVIEHRDTLSHQLDEIVLEHDILQQTIVEYKVKQKHCHPLIEQINKWERDAIEKIQQTAEETRQQVNKLISSQKETVSKELYDLAERLRKAREDDDYVETDLRTWTTKLEKLKRDITIVSPLINICEDSTKVFIAKMYVSSTRQNLLQEERFEEIFGDIRIEDNGRVALHDSLHQSDAYVRGRGEYSNGKHHIRFIINKQTASCVISFNIVSKANPISKMSSSERRTIYGWHSDDGTDNPDKDRHINNEFKDLRGEIILQLELIIDCNNRKISYFNERTKKIREMNVNIDKCPFPWQVQFYLYDIGDRVQLLSSA